MIVAICLTAVVNVLIGFFIGYISRYKDESIKIRNLEKEIYCHGYEDGFYFGWGSYDPQTFRREIAEKSYFEYKGIKYGPTKH